jgi:hypothetical protein
MLEQMLAQVRPEKSGSSSDQHARFKMQCDSPTDRCNVMRPCSIEDSINVVIVQ